MFPVYETGDLPVVLSAMFLYVVLLLDNSQLRGAPVQRFDPGHNNRRHFHQTDTEVGGHRRGWILPADEVARVVQGDKRPPIRWSVRHIERIAPLLFLILPLGIDLGENSQARTHAGRPRSPPDDNQINVSNTPVKAQVITPLPLVLHHTLRQFHGPAAA